MRPSSATPTSTSGVVDDGLALIRKLWDTGLAHRDIKPANLLVRDGHLLLIDVAFVQARPSPWRQAVDLANMMLCLALRSDPELVYQRALRQFSVAEISEAFAAARGLALPSQLRRMLRDQGRDLHAEFLDLLPARPRPIRIQRWSARRVALLLLMVPAAILLAVAFRTVLVNSDATTHAAGHATAPAATSWNRSGWRPNRCPRPPSCPASDHCQKVGRSAPPTSGTAGPGSPSTTIASAARPWSYGSPPTATPPGRPQRPPTSPGHDATSGPNPATPSRPPGTPCSRAAASPPELRSTSNGDASLIDQAASAIGFTTRHALQQALDQRSNGRLHLDPGEED